MSFAVSKAICPALGLAGNAAKFAYATIFPCGKEDTSSILETFIFPFASKSFERSNPRLLPIIKSYQEVSIEVLIQVFAAVQTYK